VAGDPTGSEPPDVGASIAAPSSVPVVPGARTELITLLVPTGPDDATPIGLDVALSIPRDVDVTRPAPAVVLLHGFASDRTSQLARAADLVEAGYVVAMPSARGAEDSAGTIALADRRREGRDLVALVDLLAARDFGRKDIVS
jgi:alpha-beta hydrolase superfamily lysophospholipase